MAKAYDTNTDKSRWYELCRQLISYGLVGVLNTLVTAVVIWLTLKQMGLSPGVSNALGYAAGVLCSFIFNSLFTFKAAYTWRHLGLFLFVFVICYALQFSVLMYLVRYSTIDPFVQQLVAMLVYNVFNFVLNKYVTFKTK